MKFYFKDHQKNQKNLIFFAKVKFRVWIVASSKPSAVAPKIPQNLATNQSYIQPEVPKKGSMEESIANQLGLNPGVPLVFHCNLCGLEFSSLDALTEHFGTVHNETQVALANEATTGKISVEEVLSS